MHLESSEVPRFGLRYKLMNYGDMPRIGTRELRMAPRHKASLPTLIRQMDFVLETAPVDSSPPPFTAHVIPEAHKDALPDCKEQALREMCYTLWRRVALVAFESRMHALPALEAS